MKIFYGLLENFMDVTDICLSKLTYNDFIIIPNNDIIRAFFFGDPIPYTVKKIFISINDNLTVYDDFLKIKIDLKDNSITTINEKEIINKLNDIHSKLKLKYGSLIEEFPEQKMVVNYLTGKEKVLEIGGNIGRNSCVIASILEDTSNFVSLESDINIANQLSENRDLNNFKFFIESSALSHRKLIQKGWETLPSDILKDGYNWVNTITFNELKTKYQIDFDTLVLDCEGAFYYILMDMPEILNNINLIIMENDYFDITQKIYIDEILTQNNFILDYVETGGWGPCFKNFFEVWKKII